MDNTSDQTKKASLPHPSGLLLVGVLVVGSLLGTGYLAYRLNSLQHKYQARMDVFRRQTTDLTRLHKIRMRGWGNKGC